MQEKFSFKQEAEKIKKQRVKKANENIIKNETVDQKETLEVKPNDDDKDIKTFLKHYMNNIVLKGKDGRITVVPKTDRKICIMGYAPASRDLPKFHGMYEAKKSDGKFEYEFWGENDLYRFIPRMDVLFQMHSLAQVKQHNRTQEHYEWLKNSKIPVVMQEHYEEIKASVPLPIKEMNNYFADYWTNSISYMIAFAIMQGPREIRIYGVDMARGSEHNEQRPSVEYYLGMAVGLGIDVFIPSECDLLKSWTRYGYDNELREKLSDKRLARLQELDDRRVMYIQDARRIEQQIEELKNQKVNLMCSAYAMDGARDDCEYWFRNLATLDKPAGDKIDNKELENVPIKKGNSLTHIHSDRE